MAIQVRKASGELEEFDHGKLVQNLKLAKIPDDIAAAAANYVKNRLEDQISTGKIHDYVQEYLNKNNLIGYALHYDLKNALLRLGPTGYAFEKFVARVLSAYGYLTRQGVIIQGKCVSHEIDVSAQKEGQHFLIECKFHNQAGVKTDVQVALYTYARFLDVRAALESLANHSQQYHQAWLVTNTKVTKDVLDYAKCMDMKVLAWGYPQMGSLREIIISSGLHPVTVLVGLNPNQYQSLFDHDIVTCADLKRAIDTNELPVTYSPELKQNLLAQIGQICR